MDTQEYILSGIVESYVLGLASDEERKEFEQMSKQYPEVLASRIAFEEALEKQAMINAIAPAATLKDKIFGQINGTGKVVSMNAAKVTKTNLLKYAAAACVILLAGSVYWNITLSNKNNSLQNNYNNTLSELDNVKKDIQVLTGNSNIKMASMKGLDASPQSYATVYWDTTSHDVYLLANNLPIAASDEQYQLWAILNGKPVDLGVFDFKKEKLLIQAKNTQGAEAFAITLEKKGRSNTTVPEGTMVVMGKL